jgi:hypothetical protein
MWDSVSLPRREPLFQKQKTFRLREVSRLKPGEVHPTASSLPETRPNSEFWAQFRNQKSLRNVRLDYQHHFPGLHIASRRQTIEIYTARRFRRIQLHLVNPARLLLSERSFAPTWWSGPAGSDSHTFFDFYDLVSNKAVGFTMNRHGSFFIGGLCKAKNLA